MTRTLRVSVPIGNEIQRELRVMCSKNGRSAAANLADLIALGLKKNDLSERFDELENSLKPSFNHAEIASTLQKIFLEFRAEIAQELSGSRSPAERKSSVSLPEKAALLLFEEALFSSLLSTEIMAADLPGTAPKPAGQHIRNARQKAKAALSNFIEKCQEE